MQVLSEAKNPFIHKKVLCRIWIIDPFSFWHYFDSIWNLCVLCALLKSRSTTSLQTCRQQQLWQQHSFVPLCSTLTYFHYVQAVSRWTWPWSLSNMNQFSQQLAALDIHREGVRNFRISVAFLRTWAFRPLGLQTFGPLGLWVIWLLDLWVFRPSSFWVFRLSGF